MNYKQLSIEFKEILQRSQEDFRRFKADFFKPIGDIFYPSLISDYPLHRRNEIQWLINYCHEMNLEITEMVIEFSKNFQEIDEFTKENFDLYLIHINNNLLTYLNFIHPKQLFVDEYEFSQFIEHRTFFENLLIEISGYRNIDSELEKIRLLDDVFRKIMPDLIRIDYYEPYDNIYAPDHYWWLHLEELYGPDFIQVKPTRKSIVYNIQRWYNPFKDNRNAWNYDLYPNPGPKDYGEVV